MRRTLLGSRCRHSLRRAGVLTLVLAGLAVGSTASAQTAAAKKAAPAPPDTSPLARYIPRENLAFFIGSDGLDTQAELWKKTAAYKILTETPLGDMLEDMTAQLAEKALAARPNRKLTGPDIVTIVKHMATGGFVIADNAPPNQGSGDVDLRSPRRRR